jgi:large subunit ribosomal protein L1
MSKHGKKYVEAKALVDKETYLVDEAIELLKKTSKTKFDATAELHMKLNVDPKHADQNVRGTVALPHGTGREVRVVAFVDESGVKAAKEAGAVAAGTKELIEKINGGWLEFDIAVADPSQMKELGKVAKILGTKGLMPNPKAGTVTMDISKTIKEIKKGKIEFRIDKLANLHTLFGKVSFDAAKLKENLLAVVRAVVEAKPASVKGIYLTSITLTSTMGPGIHMDIGALTKEAME